MLIFLISFLKRLLSDFKLLVFVKSYYLSKYQQHARLLCYIFVHALSVSHFYFIYYLMNVPIALHNNTYKDYLTRLYILLYKYINKI